MEHETESVDICHLLVSGSTLVFTYLSIYSKQQSPVQVAPAIRLLNSSLNSPIEIRYHRLDGLTNMFITTM